MKAHLKQRADGTIDEIVNLVPKERGGFSHIDLPVNAVLTQVIRGVDDEDGSPTYSTMVSIICVDEGMMPELRKTAKRILDSLYRI